MKTLCGVVALGATVLVLAGCGADAKPKFEAEPSTSPTSASPSPDEPEPWEERTDEGAIAFVEHWIDLFNASRDTGETRLLADASTERCETCSNFVALTERIYNDGGSVKTDGWRIAQVGRLPQTGSTTVVPISVRQAPQVLQESANADPQQNPGGRVGMTATVRWTASGWKMDRLDLVQ